MSLFQGSRDQLSRLADIESSRDALVAVADHRVEQMQAQHKHELDQLRGFLADARLQLKDVDAQLTESEELRGRLAGGAACVDNSLLAEVTSESVIQQEMAEQIQSCQERNAALLRELGTLSKSVQEMKVRSSPAQLTSLVFYTPHSPHPPLARAAAAACAQARKHLECADSLDGSKERHSPIFSLSEAALDSVALLGCVDGAGLHRTEVATTVYKPALGDRLGVRKREVRVLPTPAHAFVDGNDYHLVCDDVPCCRKRKRSMRKRLQLQNKKSCNFGGNLLRIMLATTSLG